MGSPFPPCPGLCVGPGWCPPWLVWGPEGQSREIFLCSCSHYINTYSPEGEDLTPGASQVVSGPLLLPLLPEAGSQEACLIPQSRSPPLRESDGNYGALPRPKARCMHKLSAVSGFPGGSDGEESACSARDQGLIPGSGRTPGEGNGSPLQCSCLENPMDGGA